jgi:hypothetical protein
MATEDSEYGGSSGIIQPRIRPGDGGEGHIDLTAAQKRFVNAVYRRRMAGIDETIPADDLHRPGVDAVLADLDNSKGTGRTAGRTPDEAEGESIS